MEILMTKIAEMLQITLEKAIEIYPVFRAQFIAVKVLGTFQQLSIWAIAIGVLVIIVTLLTWGSGEFKMAVTGPRYVRLGVSFVLVASLLLVVVNVLTFVLAPDYMLWMSLLQK